MKITFLAFCLLIAFGAYNQPLSLTEQSTISLITLGPDQNDLVQAFGHSAMRVYDPASGIDVVYNYGVFSFDQPNFYLNFARGHNYYYLGLASYPEFRDVYIYYNRYVHEQVLNLSREQRQQVFDYLQWNARPENRNYLYDYFYNNCSTKIRDVLQEVLKNNLAFDGSFIKTDYTIRELTDLYLHSLPWGDLGIDIGLGSPIDRRATPFEYMYMPEYLESSFDHATVDGHPLVKEKIIAYQNKIVPPEPTLIHPWLAFGLLLLVAIALSIRDVKRQQVSWWFDFILFAIVGLVGIVVFLLWVATDHHACARNLNLAWAIPTHLIVAAVLLKKQKPEWIRIYFGMVAAISLLLLVFWPWLPQLLNVFLIPLVATLFVRSATIFKLQSLASGS